MDFFDVLCPFAPFVEDEVIKDVIPKSFSKEGILLQKVDGFVQRSWELLDLEALLLSFAHLEDVPVHRGAAVHTLVDSIEPRGKHGGQRQVWVA